MRLAQLLEVPVVMALSSCPAGAAGDASPNWITCPWPPHYSEMLKYQWDEVGIPYWRSAAQYAEAHGIKIGMEMHPGMLVYNVETLLRMREACGPALGCNLDPSHLFWNGVDIPTAIRKLGDAIVHCHGKDSYVDQLNIAVNGCNDGKPTARSPGAPGPSAASATGTMPRCGRTSSARCGWSATTTSSPSSTRTP